MRKYLRNIFHNLKCVQKKEKKKEFCLSLRSEVKPHYSNSNVMVWQKLHLAVSVLIHKQGSVLGECAVHTQVSWAAFMLFRLMQYCHLLLTPLSGISGFLRRSHTLPEKMETILQTLNTNPKTPFISCKSKHCILHSLHYDNLIRRPSAFSILHYIQ